MTEEQLREILLADAQRFDEAWRLALKECPPVPDDYAHPIEKARWERDVNRRCRKIAKRLN